MKFLYFLLLAGFMSCSVQKRISCDENLHFKKVFFENIENVKNHTLREPNNGHFLESLDFLSNYVDVSSEKIYNYEVRYPTIEVFKMDEMNWLKWYEENKCRNIQFKSNHITPAVYKN